MPASKLTQTQTLRPARRSGPRYYSSRRRSSGRRALRGLLAVLALVVILLALLALRLATESYPPVALSRILPAAAPIAGPAPTVAWPAEGQAAVEVQGLGSLGSSGGQKPVPIASVAKMMTAYLVLRESPLSASGFTVKITPQQAEEERRRAAMGESILPVHAGERLSERQLLEALLIPSANNIAALLAVRQAGSQQAFVERMNATAKRLGMDATTYTDPSGFDSSTVSTASDQLKLAKVAMRVPGFAQLVDMREVTLPVAGDVANYDGLVGEDGYVGIKTGSDSAAGGCLVFAKKITVGGRHLTVLGAVLGQRDGEWIQAALEGARALGDSAAKDVRVGTVLAKGTTVMRARAADGATTDVLTTRALRTVGWAGMRVHLKLAKGGAGKTLRAGQALGSVSIAGWTGPGERTPVVARGELGSPSLGWRLAHLF